MTAITNDLDKFKDNTTARLGDCVLKQDFQKVETRLTTFVTKAQIEENLIKMENQVNKS